MAVVLVAALVGVFATLNALLALMFEVRPFPGQGTSDLAVAGYAAGALAGVVVPGALAVVLLRHRLRWAAAVGAVVVGVVVLAAVVSGIALA